jgi:FkbM family methyltransferase
VVRVRRRSVRAERLGLQLDLDLRDGVQYCVYEEGAWEPSLSERIISELRRGDVFVDIGAHVGIHALVAARELQRLGAGHVFAFEPATDSADRIEKAIERNRINNLKLVRAAIGESAGRIALRSDPTFGKHDAGVRSAFGPGNVVGEFPRVSFDGWALEAGLSRLDLMKIDIEGGELGALIGMRQTLARLHPRLLFIEVNSVTLERAGVTKEQLYAELERSGYAPIETISDYEVDENVVFGPYGSSEAG